MLTLARLAPDAVSFQPTSVQLGDVLKTTIADLAPAVLAKRMDVEFTGRRPAVVSGDAGLLGILFRNVIDNAIRYSPPSTKIDVELDVTESEAQVRVRDAGRGCPAASAAGPPDGAGIIPGWISVPA